MQTRTMIPASAALLLFGTPAFSQPTGKGTEQPTCPPCVQSNSTKIDDPTLFVALVLSLALAGLVGFVLGALVVKVFGGSKAERQATSAGQGSLR